MINTLIAFTVALGASSQAQASQDMCGELKDQFTQAVHYHEIAKKLQDKETTIMIPVGHFTSYVNASEAYTIAEAQMELIIMTFGNTFLMTQVLLL